MYTVNIFLDKNLISTKDDVVDYTIKPVTDTYAIDYSMELLVKRRFAAGIVDEDYVHQLWISKNDEDWMVVIVDEDGNIDFNSFNNFVPPIIANANKRDESGLLIYDRRGRLIDMP